MSGGLPDGGPASKQPPVHDWSAHDSMSYEELVEALEHITRRMAEGEIGIEQAADLYEQAKRLEASARERLDRVRRRIDTLSEEGDAGADDHPVT